MYQSMSAHSLASFNASSSGEAGQRLLRSTSTGSVSSSSCVITPVELQAQRPDTSSLSSLSKIAIVYSLSIILVLLGMHSRGTLMEYKKNHDSNLSSSVASFESSFDHSVPVAKEPLFCPGKFDRDSSHFVPSSCTVFSKHDMNMEHIKESPVFYMCASESLSPVNILPSHFQGYGLINENKEIAVSFIKSGHGVSMTVFDSDEKEHTASRIDKKNRFRGSDFDKDNLVASAMITSNALAMPVSCDELYKAIDAGSD